MPRGIKLIIVIYLLATPITVLGLFTNKIFDTHISENIISPHGDSFSVLAITTKNDYFEGPQHIVYGFLPFWSLEHVEHLQLDKLTDIAYFALNIDEEGHIKTLTDEGGEDPGYSLWKESEKLDKLLSEGKERGIRFSLTIISHEDEVSNKFLECTNCWNTFVNELINELNSKNIQHVNLDFEYAEEVDEEIANQYTLFVDFVNKKLDEKFGNSFVMVSTFADAFKKSRITKVDDLAKIADGLFIMGYDFHRPTSDNAGPIAPINGLGKEHEYDIQTMLTDYQANVPPNKMILGVPYYGYNWVVGKEEPYAERIEGNDVLGYSGSQTYADIMETRLEYNPEVMWDEVGKAPYFTYVSEETGSAREVYYEDVKSLRIKYKLAKDLNLAGIGIWALGYDMGYQELWQLLNDEFFSE